MTQEESTSAQSSGSMTDKMDRVREAVDQFCRAANPQDEFFLITFAEQPRLASDFTTAPEDLQSALLFTQPKGRTALLDAIYMGIGKMRGLVREESFAHYFRRRRQSQPLWRTRGAIGGQGIRCDDLFDRNF